MPLLASSHHTSGASGTSSQSLYSCDITLNLSLLLLSCTVDYPLTAGAPGGGLGVLHVVPAVNEHHPTDVIPSGNFGDGDE